MGVPESHLLALPGETLAEDDAECMPGKPRTRLTPDLDNGFLMEAAVFTTEEGNGNLPVCGRGVGMRDRNDDNCSLARQP